MALSQSSRCLVRITSIYRQITRSSVMLVGTTLDEGIPRSVREEKEVINGAPLHYARSGVGRHAVLLLPGALGSSKTDFLPQLLNMNREIFTLFAMDPRGYGKSRPPERDWPDKFLERDADDAACLMEKLGVDKYSVLGWSDGGIMGLILAARSPDKIRKLVVWGANAYMDNNDMTILEGMRDISKWSERMRQPFVDLYGQEYFLKHWNKWLEAYGSYLKKFDGDICKGELKNIECPTLIIHGQKDPIIPQHHADYLKENIRNSELKYLPDGKHNLHLRHYREFNSIVEHFLLSPDEQ